MLHTHNPSVASRKINDGITTEFLILDNNQPGDTNRDEGDNEKRKAKKKKKKKPCRTLLKYFVGISSF